MERAWRKSKLDVFYLAWCDSVLNYKCALNTARTAHFSGLINNNKHNPRFLFHTVAKLTQKPQSVSCAPFKANDFLDFFCNKIDGIRIKINSLASSSKFAKKYPAADSQLVLALKTFENISLEIQTKIVSSSKPTTCVLDPFPTKLFKELWPAVGPTVLNIVNSSLMTGVVPASLKSAVVKFLLSSSRPRIAK